jgi:hypothetical protein
MPLGRKALMGLMLAVLVVPACGGGDDGEGVSREGVSREDYAEQVNEVCADVERELRELVIAGPETSAEITELIDDVAAKSRAAVDRLATLERPSGDAREIADRFVETLERELETDALPALEDLSNAIRRGDREAAADAAERLTRLENAESDRFARQLGADACAA